MFGGQLTVDSLGDDLYEPWLHWGITGLSALTLSTIVSIRPIRTRFYEFFLVSHITL